MNEFDKRMLDIAQRQQDLDAVLMAMGRNVLKEHFGYTTQVTAFGSNDPLLTGQFTNIISIQSDAWFVLHSISSCVVPGDNLGWFVDSGSMKIQITDTGSGYVLYSNPSTAGVLTSVNNRAITGVPFLLPVPHIIPPNSNIKVDLTQFADLNNPTFDNAAVYVSLLGTRVAMI